MKLDVPVELPDWALEAGIPLPHDGEKFRAYFRRLGMSPEKIDLCFTGLTRRTAVIANARVSTYLREMCPQAFEKALARRLRKFYPDDSFLIRHTVTL